MDDSHWTAGHGVWTSVRKLEPFIQIRSGIVAIYSVIRVIRGITETRERLCYKALSQIGQDGGGWQDKKAVSGMRSTGWHGIGEWTSGLTSRGWQDKDAVGRIGLRLAG